MSTPLDRSSVPKLAPGCDLTRLPIGAREGFVLSRVDGATSLGDIAALTGFPVDEVERIFTRLVELRAAFFGDAPPWTPPPPKAEPKPEAAEARSDAAKPAGAAPKPTSKKRPRRWQAAELDEPADLDRALKERILDAFTWLDDLDHYELLGVARDADRKAIKSAYYGLAATFHTDRHFGKELGTFKSKMEQIFGRITQAHDTLANRQRRAEYDAYLVDRDRTKAFERYLAGEDAFEDDAGGDDEPQPVAGKPESVPPAATSSAPARPVASQPPAGAPTLDDDQRLRREALARRLAGASSGRFRAAPNATTPPRAASVAPKSSLPPAAPTAEQAQAATEAIRRRYEEGRDNARRVQAKRMVDAADDALKRDDLVSAANHLRLALRYSDDPDLAARYEDVNRRARDSMAETYLKQARYEEQQGKWQAAALSYVKAHEGRPDDGTLCERAANAFRLEGRDLHKAARFAELAVQKNPSSAAFRVTLGAVYLDAGLFLRARSELEHAAKLDAGDATIKDLLARARKMAS